MTLLSKSPVFVSFGLISNNRTNVLFCYEIIACQYFQTTLLIVFTRGRQVRFPTGISLYSNEKTELFVRMLFIN